jgi:hypothetical protein
MDDYALHKIVQKRRRKLGKLCAAFREFKEFVGAGAVLGVSVDCSLQSFNLGIEIGLLVAAPREQFRKLFLGDFACGATLVQLLEQAAGFLAPPL